MPRSLPPARRSTRSAVGSTWRARWCGAQRPGSAEPAPRPRRGTEVVRIGIGAIAGILGGPATYARQLVGALAREGGHEYVVFTDLPGALAALGGEVVHVPPRTPYHQPGWDHGRPPRPPAGRAVGPLPGKKTSPPRRP